MPPTPLLNRCTTPKIAEPRWWYTAVPKRLQLSEKSQPSERDSTLAPSRLLSGFTEGR